MYFAQFVKNRYTFNTYLNCSLNIQRTGNISAIFLYYLADQIEI